MADVWLCYDPSNKTDMWLSCIQRSRCRHRTAITICTDEIRDSAMLDVRLLLSLQGKHKIINVQAVEVSSPPPKNQNNILTWTCCDEMSATANLAVCYIIFIFGGITIKFIFILIWHPFDISPSMVITANLL